MVRTSARLQLSDGRSIARLGPEGTGLTAWQEAQLRGGSDVAIGACIEIPAPTWDRVEHLEDVRVELFVELVFVADAGEEEVFDSVRVTGTVDPSGEG